MKILQVRVRWWVGYGNLPDLEVLAEGVPHLSELTYQMKDSCVYAEKDGYVHFLAIGPEQTSYPTRGFGGHKWTMKLENGETLVSTNAWSSRSGAMHQLGFPPCKEVSLTDEPEVWERGYTFTAGAVSKDLLETFLQEHPLLYGGKQVELYLCRRYHPPYDQDEEPGSDWSGEFFYVPSLEGMDPDQSKTFLENEGIIVNPNPPTCWMCLSKMLPKNIDHTMRAICKDCSSAHTRREIYETMRRQSKEKWGYWPHTSFPFTPTPEELGLWGEDGEGRR